LLMRSSILGQERNSRGVATWPTTATSRTTDERVSICVQTYFAFVRGPVQPFLAVSFLVPTHRVWFIYAAAAVAFGGILPVLRVVPYRHSLDIHNRRDKRFLLFVGVYVALILVVACLVVYFVSRR
jgi:hypothetical protein